MTSDYVDNWDALPPTLQAALLPILTTFDDAADLLFDRRLNLSFEAAVKDLSVPGFILLTDALRALREFLQSHVTVEDAPAGVLRFNSALTFTAYDLPLYTPCLYVSQLAQAMHEANVRVWKDSTAQEIGGVLLVMARYVRPDIEVARVCIAALHDIVLLYPAARVLLEDTSRSDTHFPNATQITAIARQLLLRSTHK